MKIIIIVILFTSYKYAHNSGVCRATPVINKTRAFVVSLKL